jgi:hypothetical protein
MFNLPQDENIEQLTFGTWFVLASASISGGIYAFDTLTFKVGYLMTANIKTVAPVQFPEPLVEKQNFARGNEVGIVITLTNIAMSTKDVTLSFVVMDAMNQEIYVSSPVSFIMPSGNFVYPLIKFLIPNSAATGTATIRLNIYKESSGRVDLYSPQKSATFNIQLIDVAVTSVTLSSAQVYIGEMLDISINVKNLGEMTETFNVTIYYTIYLNSTAIKTLNVASLEPNGQKTLSFSWNTSNINEGTYTISAVASQVPDEVNTSNNRYVAGQIKITQRPPPPPPPTPINPRNLFFILWIILLLFLIALLALLVLRRRKKDESGTLEQMSYFT